MKLLNKIFLSLVAGLLALSGLTYTSATLAADPQHETDYNIAAYCHRIAQAFKDADMEKRWRSVKGKYLPVLPEDWQTRVTRDAGKQVDSEAQSLTATAFRNKYQQCKNALSDAEKIAQSIHEKWATDYSAQLDKQKIPYRNPYAPVKYTTIDLVGDLAGSRDLAEHEKFKNKARAWDAYCLVASESLYAFVTQNSAAFGLDPKQPEDAQTLKLVDSNRRQFRNKLLEDFNADQQAAQQYAAIQQENYRKGFDQHKSSDADVVNFAKVQASDCDSNFDLWWNTSPISAVSKHMPATQYGDPFSLLKRAQYCYSIDVNSEPFPNQYITPEQKKWQVVFLATQWWSALQGYDLFATGHIGLELSPFARDDYIDYGPEEHNGCVAEINEVVSALPALMETVYAPNTRSTFDKNIVGIAGDNSYFSKPRTNEDLWCYALMDQVLQTSDANPKMFEAMKIETGEKDLRAFFESRKSFWGNATETQTYNYKRFIGDVKKVLDDLKNPGIGTSDELNSEAMRAFFVGGVQRCAMRERFLRSADNKR